MNRINVKQIIPSDIINILESDFSKSARENDPVSQEDLKILAKLKEDNPADHALRGLTAQQVKNSIWFTGPKFLC